MTAAGELLRGLSGRMHELLEDRNVSKHHEKRSKHKKTSGNKWRRMRSKVIGGCIGIRYLITRIACQEAEIQHLAQSAWALAKLNSVGSSTQIFFRSLAAAGQEVMHSFQTLEGS